MLAICLLFVFQLYELCCELSKVAPTSAPADHDCSFLPLSGFSPSDAPISQFQSDCDPVISTKLASSLQHLNLTRCEVFLCHQFVSFQFYYYFLFIFLFFKKALYATNITFVLNHKFHFLRIYNVQVSLRNSCSVSPTSVPS